MNPEFRSTVIGAGALSPDGYFYWDGVQWKATIRADGAWRWDGAVWAPAGQSPVRSYASAQKLGVWVSVLLGGCISIAFVQVLVVDPYYRIWLGLGDQYVAYTVDVAGLFSFLITSLLLVVWFYRAYQECCRPWRHGSPVLFGLGRRMVVLADRLLLDALPGRR